MESKKIYVISGLGADERVFQCLDFAGYDTYFVKWISVRKNETIDQYAGRLLNQFLHPDPILIGLSFGGIMAIEIAKQISIEKVILIASLKNRKEIPFCYRLAGKINLHKIVPTAILKRSTILTNYFFGVSSAWEKDILREILLDTDAVFLKWAIDQIVKWRNTVTINNLKHIHGTKDRIIPISSVIADYKIPDGGHLMTLSHPEEIMEILKQEL